MLFNFDEEGNPQVYSKVESEKNAMSLQYLVNHWTQAMESMNSDAFINNMTGRSQKTQKKDTKKDTMMSDTNINEYYPKEEVPPVTLTAGESSQVAKPQLHKKRVVNDSFSLRKALMI